MRNASAISSKTETNRTNRRGSFVIFAVVCILLATLCTLFLIHAAAEEEEPAGEYVKVGNNDPKSIDTGMKLVDAILAIVEWRSKGEATTLTAVFNEGTTENPNYVRVSSFERIYTEIYDRLLALYDDRSDKTVLYGTKSTFTDDSISTSTVLWKTYGDMTLPLTKTVSGGRLIILLDPNDPGVINFADSDSQLKVTSGSLAILGRSPSQEIRVTSTCSNYNVSGALSPIRVGGGKLYLQYCDMHDFDFGDESLSAILFPTGNSARYFYMSDSKLRNITAHEAPGIFCKIYAEKSNTNAEKSRLYINYSTFQNCVTYTGASNTVGGSAIRSYAADVCQLVVRNSDFIGNRVGSKTTAQSGESSGGGAIYWKSVDGKATLIGCSFTNNHSSVVGGAILNTGTMDIQGCTFTGNTALKDGGAIAAEPPYTSSEYTSITGTTQDAWAEKQLTMSGALTLDGTTTISGNTAYGNGGGIYFNAKSSQIHSDYKIKVFNMQLTVDGAEISGNTAHGNGGGVAIYLNYGEYHYTTGVTIEDGSRIVGNTADKNGGAIWISSDANCDCNENMGVTMNGGALEDNHAINGGAIYIEAGKSTVETMNFYVKGGSIVRNYANVATGEARGGAAYINGGSVEMTDGIVEACTAKTDGGAIFVEGGSFTMSGGAIRGGSASQNGQALAQNGGAVYVSDGNVTIAGAEISSCVASQNGGAAYIAGGSFILSTGSTISGNSADNGGAAYVANGNVTITGGLVAQNVATQNGGAFAITNGSFSMTGGSLIQNRATNGDGGALYASTSEDATILIRSGMIAENVAGGSGGALSVYGQNNVHLTITIGSNTSHKDTEVGYHVCAEQPNPDETCPDLHGNSSAVSAGAIYLSGSYDAVMNMFCLEEKDNVSGGGISQSHFMKVDGGTLNISSKGPDSSAEYGRVVINSSILVAGGQVTLSGTKSNPCFNDSVTVNVEGSEDFFRDLREGGSVTTRTIQYFENFDDSGQYILIDVPITESHIVREGMYTRAGRQITCWEQMEKNGDDYVSIGEIWFGGDIVPAGEDTLIFFAVWQTFGYTIVFSPGEIEGSFIYGSMSEQGFSYTDEKPLSLNAYYCVGYKFLYWVDDSDGTKTYTDGKVVKELTAVDGATINLIAVWEKCDHERYGEYELVKTDSTATRTCPCKGYTESASLVGFTVTYSGDPYAASFTHDPMASGSSTNGLYPSTPWTPGAILYSGNTYGGATLSGVTEALTEAGEYTASISIADGIILTVNILIEKAERTITPAKPLYDKTAYDNGTPSDTKDDYYIVLIEDLGDTSGIPLEYLFSWYEDDSLETSGPILWDALNPPSQQLLVTYTNYYVDVRYAETANYKASGYVRGTTVIIWTGDVAFAFDSGEGLNHSYIEANESEGIRVTLIPQAGFYIYGVEYDYSVRAADENGTLPPGYEYELSAIVMSIQPDGSWIAWLKDIPSSPGAVSIEVDVLFEGAVKIVTVESAVTKNEEFRELDTRGENAGVTVSRDSAYTASFKVDYFLHYSAPRLRFSSALPIGTTVIMLDLSDHSYWYYSAETATESILLSDFYRMGAAKSDATRFSLGTRSAFTLQFVVDFSNCTVAPTYLNMTASFTATPIQPSGNTVPTISASGDAVAQVALGNTPSFALGETTSESDGELSKTISYQFAIMSDESIGMSKWEGISGILLVEPNGPVSLPADVRLQVRIKQRNSSEELTRTYSLVNGKFMVVIPSIGSGTASLTLLSDMFPNEADYSFSVSLCVSATAVSETPYAPIAGVENVSVSYTVRKQTPPTVSVEMNGELPMCYVSENNETLLTTLSYSGSVQGVGATDSVRAVLYSKNANGGYTATTQKTVLEINDGRFEATHDFEAFKAYMLQTAGSINLMMSIEVVDSTGKVLASAPLYFILIDTRQ